MKLKLSVATILVSATISAWGQAYQHGALVRSANIYISPDTTSAKLGEVGRGREIIILETPRGWLHVQANVTEERTIAGWILDKGVILASTPNGDRILYGEGVDSEDQATRRRGRKGADRDAMRLYYRVYELFPSSPLAGEALYRAADIRWQVDKVDIMTKPSAREQDAFLRGEIDERLMKEVIKKFPGSRWADLASFQLLDNKVCGDWQGVAKCPEKEASMFEKYANEHPQSAKAAEALYAAAWRYSALIEIYKTDNDSKKSDESKSKAIALAQKIVSQFSQSDWGARSQRLLYLMQQNIPTYGNVEE